MTAKVLSKVSACAIGLAMGAYGVYAGRHVYHGRQRVLGASISSMGVHWTTQQSAALMDGKTLQCPVFYSTQQGGEPRYGVEKSMLNFPLAIGAVVNGDVALARRLVTPAPVLICLKGVPASIAIQPPPGPSDCELALLGLPSPVEVYRTSDGHPVITRQTIDLSCDVGFNCMGFRVNEVGMNKFVAVRV